MVKRIEHVRNARGQNFLAVKMDTLELHEQMTEMRSLVGKEKFNMLVENSKSELGDFHYVTVIDASEYLTLTQQIGLGRFVEELQPVLDFEIDDIVLGEVVGLRSNGDETYSVVCESDKLGAVRTRFGLPMRDFCAAIGLGVKGLDKKRDC